MLDAVARDALDVALRRAGKRYKVGEFELGEDSYQQVLIWAEASGLSPGEVMEKAWEAYLSDFAWRDTPPEFIRNGKYNRIMAFDEIVARVFRIPCHWHSLNIQHVV